MLGKRCMEDHEKEPGGRRGNMFDEDTNDVLLIGR